MSQTEIELAEREWNQAILARNDQSISEMLLESFVCVMHGGRVLDKTQFTNDLRAGQRTLNSIDVEDLKIRLFGQTAIVTGTLLIKGKLYDTFFAGPSRITRVWVRNGSSWKLATMHASDARVITTWNKLSK